MNKIIIWVKKKCRKQHKVTEKFAFCESVYATSTSPWHIRKLTDKGFKLSGGADTNALCNREVSWDLDVEITQHHLSHCCRRCAEIFCTDKTR